MQLEQKAEALVVEAFVQGKTVGETAKALHMEQAFVARVFNQQRLKVQKFADAYKGAAVYGNA